jgi:hypothetical protein
VAPRRPSVGRARGFSRSGPPPRVPRRDEAQWEHPGSSTLLAGALPHNPNPALLAAHGVGPSVCPPVAYRYARADRHAGRPLPLLG